MCYACFRGSFISSRLRGVCCCCCLVVKSWPTLCDPMEYSPPGSSCLWDFPGKNTGVGCHFLFQGIFLTRRVVWWAQNIFLCPVSMQPHLTIFCISLIFTFQREESCPLRVWNLAKSRDFCVSFGYFSATILSFKASLRRSHFWLFVKGDCYLWQSSGFSPTVQTQWFWAFRWRAWLLMTSLHCPVRSSLLSPAMP